MKNPHTPAHPIINNEDPEATETHYGLTKREYFAGLALQGMLARKFDLKGEDLTDTIQSAIEYADELLKQLETK